MMTVAEAREESDGVTLPPCEGESDADIEYVAEVVDEGESEGEALILIFEDVDGSGGDGEELAEVTSLEVIEDEAESVVDTEFDEEWE